MMTTAAVRNGTTGACPVCGSRAIRRIRSASELACDLGEVLACGRHLMHSTPATVSRCAKCDSVFRHPAVLPTDLVTRYGGDKYGEAELERLYRRGSIDYGSDGTWLRTHRLEPGARVLEIGSYVGALLSYLRRMGCDATGIDIGQDVSEFARSQGLHVHTRVFDPDDFPAHSFDAVVVVNCFEQLPDPPAALDGIARVLRVGGTLVIRTPNADFVAKAHLPRVRPLAAANGILGVPFVRCFSPSALTNIVSAHGLAPLRLSAAPWMDLVAVRPDQTAAAGRNQWSGRRC